MDTVGELCGCSWIVWVGKVCGCRVDVEMGIRTHARMHARTHAEMWSYALSHVTAEAMNDTLERAYILYYLSYSM